ncbi:YciI family protein [Roseimaritima ulvae]|uniref:YCII-related domain protein n=1 Tax=Roseimaritima ulvae TaxID=980254 RepID=A0A5B9QPM0_9BACT|nr:YciI family protein [Roseimaritima ulvae]QEG40904.1 YCII-related domain protein [Roseimaritima ulvae]
MKFICLGYSDHSKFESMSEAEMQSLMEECFAYDDVLREGGHFAGGEALQAADQAVTLRHHNGSTEATDGPFAETKEQLGGILILEADDMAHAVALMSKHPGAKVGPFEIRPADETINAMIEARNQAHQNR